MLLERGISPNMHGRLLGSQFIYFLETFPYFDEEKVMFQYWCRKLKVMLLYGAKA
jgi:hypothetical protein